MILPEVDYPEEVLRIYTEKVISSEESFQVQGMGGCTGRYTGVYMAAYKLTLPPDFPYGIEPDTIIDNSTTFANFYKAINIMANESQVLILIQSVLDYKNAYCHIVNDLEKNSYIVHPLLDNDSPSRVREPQNEEARKWVRAHQPQIKKIQASCGEQKINYLIGDWFSTAGYEVPAVIFVTWKLDDPKNATFCQRAKAKLVIYHAPNAFR